MNRQTEEAVAVKVIDTSQAKECAENVKKEVCVHKVAQSPALRLDKDYRSIIVTLCNISTPLKSF